MLIYLVREEHDVKVGKRITGISKNKSNRRKDKCNRRKEKCNRRKDKSLFGTGKKNR